MRQFSNHSIIILCNAKSITPEQGGDSDRGERGKERGMEVRERWREWERGLHVQVFAEVLMVSSQASASSKEASTKAHGPSSSLKSSSVVPVICMSIHKQRGVSYLGISAKATRPEPRKALLKDRTDQQWAVRAATDSAKDYLHPLWN